MVNNKVQSEIKPIDLSKKLEAYENKWIAFSFNHQEILGVGETLREAKRKASLKAKEFILIKLPPFNVSYVPTNL